MTATVLGIIAIVVAAVPIVYMAKANARETARLRQEAISKAVEDAERPLKDRIAVLTVENDRLQRENDRLEARVDVLGDELRRRPQ